MPLDAAMIENAPRVVAVDCPRFWLYDRNLVPT